MGRNDPWQGVANVVEMAALIGAGVGAASALMYARHAGAQEGEIGALEQRLGAVEQLRERVTQLKARAPAATAKRNVPGSD